MDSAREWKLATAMAGGLSRMACGDDAGDECAMAMAVSAMLSPMAAMTMAAVAMATAVAAGLALVGRASPRRLCLRRLCLRRRCRRRVKCSSHCRGELHWSEGSCSSQPSQVQPGRR